MSAAARSVPRPRSRRDAILATGAVAAGVLVLLARPFVAGSAGSRTTLFTASYLAIGAASLAVPVPAAARRVRPVVIATVLAIGASAIALAAILTGPAIPAPASAAALPLALLAAVAEEALFRRLAFSRLERFGAVVAVVGSASLFALVHVPAYGTAALPVDLGAGLLFGWQRWASGTWTVPAATHAFANVLAVLR
jgi:membrane protease YdiL (CAAX protease family)